MSPDLVLNLSLVALGLIVAYAAWFYTRDSIFQLKMITIAMEMENEQRSHGRIDDPAYLSLRSDLARLSQNIAYLNIPVIFFYQRQARRRGAYRPLSVSFASQPYLERPDEVPPAVRRAFNKAMTSLFFHVILDPLGLAILFMLASFERTNDVFGDLLNFIQDLIRNDRQVSARSSG